ncbi:MAG: polysaccharide deacetylase family protein [Kiloniellales bacterium]
MQPASIVLLFHAVGTPEATGYKDAIPVEAFDRALHWLQANYRVVPLDDLAARQALGEDLTGLAALSFDDNHRSVAEVGLPLVAARGLPATWYLMTAALAGEAYWRRKVTRVLASGQEAAFRAFLQARAPALAEAIRPGRLYKDSKDPTRVSPSAMAELFAAFDPSGGPEPDFVTPGEVAALDLPGITLGNHSHRHLVMSGLSAEAQQREIAVASEALSHFPQPKSRLFCVPFGGAKTYNSATLEATALAGLAGLAVTADGLVDADDFARHPLLAAESFKGQALARCLSLALGAVLS